MFATALIHTLALSLVGHDEDPVDMNSLYCASAAARNAYGTDWTGVAALVPQAWLTFASASPLRHAGWEIFKILHFLAAVLFLFFLIIHVDVR